MFWCHILLLYYYTTWSRFPWLFPNLMGFIKCPNISQLRNFCFAIPWPFLSCFFKPCKLEPEWKMDKLITLMEVGRGILCFVRHGCKRMSVVHLFMDFRLHGQTKNFKQTRSWVGMLAVLVSISCQQMCNQEHYWEGMSLHPRCWTVAWKFLPVYWEFTCFTPWCHIWHNQQTCSQAIYSQ